MNLTEANLFTSALEEERGGKRRKEEERGDGYNERVNKDLLGRS